MANTVNIMVARSALSRIKAQGLKGAKADRVALEFVCGALAYAMGFHGEDSAEASALAMLSMMTATRGAAYLVDSVAKHDAASTTVDSAAA